MLAYGRFNSFSSRRQRFVRHRLSLAFLPPPITRVTRAAGARPGIRGLLEEMREFMLGRSEGAAPATPEAQQEVRSGASPIDLKTQKLTSVLASFWPGLYFRAVEKES